MKYVPRYAAWELTNACNAKCLHCGSQSGTCRDNELTLDEALHLCDEMAAAGLYHLTLMGGEFFLSPHWEQVAKRLVDLGVIVAPLTNGLLLNEKNIQKLKAIGIDRVGVSLDGLAETHDYIRGVPNLFNRAVENLRLAKKEGLKLAIITAASALNVDEIPDLYEFVKTLDVSAWQIQLVEDVGNAFKNEKLSMGLDNLYKLAKNIAKFRRQEKNFKILAGDNVGYFTSFEPYLRDHPFTGCQAGRQVVGIEANGNIRGCLSVIGCEDCHAGNIRERAFADIWNDPNNFTQFRDRTVDKLTGFCAECKYKDLCRAGCSSMAFSLTGSFYENPLCLHKYEIENGLNES